MNDKQWDNLFIYLGRTIVLGGLVWLALYAIYFVFI